MGELLFYKYLKYHKEHSKPIKQRLFGLPCSVIIEMIQSSGAQMSGIPSFALKCLHEFGCKILRLIFKNKMDAHVAATILKASICQGYSR